MKKVDKSKVSSPTHLSGKNCNAKIKDALLNQKNHNFSNYDYAHEDVKKALTAIYNGKCAYCERRIELQVEHYRPKNAVKENSQHQGYYWLAYEWTNLLYACGGCNSNKGSSFPLENEEDRVHNHLELAGELVDDSERLKAEKPLLLNPEIDTPLEHLEHLPNGKLRALTQKGRKTIEVCHLNENENILKDRQERLNFFKEKLEDAVYEFNEKIIKLPILEDRILAILKDIKQLIEKDSPYLLLYVDMLFQFKFFFIDNFIDDLKNMTLLPIYESVEQNMKDELKTILQEQNYDLAKRKVKVLKLLKG